MVGQIEFISWMLCVYLAGGTKGFAGLLQTGIAGPQMAFAEPQMAIAGPQMAFAGA